MGETGNKKSLVEKDHTKQIMTQFLQFLGFRLLFRGNMTTFPNYLDFCFWLI